MSITELSISTESVNINASAMWLPVSGKLRPQNLAFHN